MRRLSLKVTEPLYRDLEEKANELEVSLSEIMRDCLIAGLSHLDPEQVHKDTSEKHPPLLQKRIAVNTLFTYCLLEEYIKRVADGKGIIEIAESNAEEMVNAMLAKHKEKHKENH